MPSLRMLSAVAVVALVPAAGAAGHSLGAGARPAQAPTREALAQVVKPPGAPGRTLGLSRVTIPARTTLAPHRHPGDQIAYLERGTLTYTVRTGVVRIYRGAADASPQRVGTIRAGQTERVRAGEWVVERQGDVHFGADRGRRPVVILLATLFTTGSPASIPVPYARPAAAASHGRAAGDAGPTAPSPGQPRACLARRPRALERDAHPRAPTRQAAPGTRRTRR